MKHMLTVKVTPNQKWWAKSAKDHHHAHDEMSRSVDGCIDELMSPHALQADVPTAAGFFEWCKAYRLLDLFLASSHGHPLCLFINGLPLSNEAEQHQALPFVSTSALLTAVCKDKCQLSAN